jgi:DNA-binding phage protein
MNISAFADASLSETNQAVETACVRAIDYVAAFLQAKTGQWGDLTRLQRLTKIAQGQLSEMRQGKGNPTLEKLDALASAYGVDAAAIFALSPPDTAPDDPSARKGTAEVDPAVGPRHNLATSAGPTPRKDVAAVLQAVPLSPAHLTLYGLIGTLTIEEALRLRLQLVQLIERAQHPARPARHPKRPEKK